MIPREIVVPPCWRITRERAETPATRGNIVLGSGMAFGDGTHETTQLGLQAVAAYAPRNGAAWRCLDVGTGTGVLAIAAAYLGAEVVAVEIDAVALETAAANAERNGLTDRIEIETSLDLVAGHFDLVIANITREVLLDLANGIAVRTQDAGSLILTGLVSTDVPAIIARYLPLLGGRRPLVHRRGEWVALSWPPSPGRHS